MMTPEKTTNLKDLKKEIIRLTDKGFNVKITFESPTTGAPIITYKMDSESFYGLIQTNEKF